MSDRTEVTAGGIARLAGVGRAAVSNWRRRHPDFPRPVGGTETSPAFDLAEVEGWLRRQGKLTRVPLREQVWQQVEADPAGTAAALVRAGSVLLLAQAHPEQWSGPGAAREGLAEAVAQVLAARLGEGHPVPTDEPGIAARLPLLRAVAELAGELGCRQAYEFLLGRHLDANPRQSTPTPAATAELMAALAGPARTVLDPAAGAGALLRAAALPDTEAVYAQESDPELAVLGALRLALAFGGQVRVRVADTLRADAYPDLAADAVLCHPPFNERGWGHEDLAYDPRWEYGLPARAESELAWVQHALARTRPGGSAVLLLPPAVASRRSGRRIRADLLRRGALRAVIALPAGAAPPYGIPLHLWVLRRPTATAATAPRLLLVDAGALPSAGGPQAARDAVVGAWESFDQGGDRKERPGVSRVLPVLELLDDDVDLAPARHLPPAADGGVAGLGDVRERLSAALLRTSQLTPEAAAAEPARRTLTTVGELARHGALVMRAGGGGAAPGGGGPAVLTEHDVVAGCGPTGILPDGPAEEPVLVREGDVVLPVVGKGSVARVVDTALAGAALGRGVHLLRCDPAALDPWFVAGFLRGSANARQASSYTTTSTRLDVRRLRIPRLPLADQRRYSERFRTLAAFEEALRLAGELGEQLVRGLYDGLTDGSVRPD